MKYYKRKIEQKSIDFEALNRSQAMERVKTEDR